MAVQQNTTQSQHWLLGPAGCGLCIGGTVGGGSRKHLHKMHCCVAVDRMSGSGEVQLVLTGIGTHL